MIHNMADARFKAGLFGKMSAMERFSNARPTGISFTDERVTVARALSRLAGKPIFTDGSRLRGRDPPSNWWSPSRNEDTREAVQVFRRQLGNRFELLRLVLSPWPTIRGQINATVERLTPEGQWAVWRTFPAAASKAPKSWSRAWRFSDQRHRGAGTGPVDLAGVVDQDFRWLRGDLQMQSPPNHAKGRPAPRPPFTIWGIDFRLNGDPSFPDRVGRPDSPLVVPPTRPVGQ